MKLLVRLRDASRAALLHLLGSAVVACVAAAVVFLFWYPHPYNLLSGGGNLFAILIAVDVVCGPLLTLILVSPKKSRREFIVDILLIVAIQFAALAYGLVTVYQVRPLFLVHEVDRYRVISMPEYGDIDVSKELAALPVGLTPKFLGGPVVVGIRSPLSQAERQDVMLESAFGGRDYSQRPEYYVPYDTAYQLKAVQRARPLSGFLERYQDTAEEANKIAASQGITISDALFLPVLHKQDWIAMMDKSGRILGFLPGDGFSIPVKR